MSLRRVALVAAIAVSARSAATAAQDAGPAVPVDSAITGWLDLVARGAGAAAWAQAGPYFRERLDHGAWLAWVAAQRPRLGGLGARKLLAVSAGRDEAPLPELDWVVATFASDRPAGGRIFERVWAWREPGEPYRVANYGAWPDPEAVVHNAYLDPVPYAILWGGAGIWRGHVLGVRRRQGAAEAPPSRGTAVANPRTFPRRPPDRP